MKTHFYTTLGSPIGEIVLTASDQGLTGVYTPEHSYYKKAKKGVSAAKPFQQAVKQLKEYFAGGRRDFDVLLASEGTEFQKRIWTELRKIPYGRTKSYGDIAKSIKSPKASRAVGMANSKNPVCIIVPCHRVIGANGKLTGYAGGMKAKQWLLEHEAKGRK